MRKERFVFLPEFKHNCLRGCLYNCLQFKGYEKPLRYIDSSVKLCLRNEFNDNIVSNYGLYSRYQEMVYANFGQSNKVWKEDLHQLQKGVELIFDVDVFYLPYRNEYMKHHGSHGIICQKAIGDKVKIIDWCEPYFFCDTVDVDVILHARESINPYDNNPYSGKALNCFSLGIIGELGEPSEEECLHDWAAESRIELDILEKIIGVFRCKEDMHNNSLVEKICNYFYLLQSDVVFSKLFLSSLGEKCKNTLEIVTSILVELSNLHYLLLRACVSESSKYYCDICTKLRIIHHSFSKMQLYINAY